MPEILHHPRCPGLSAAESFEKRGKVRGMAFAPPRRLRGIGGPGRLAPGVMEGTNEAAERT